MLHVIFGDGKDCIYNVKDDIDTIKSYKDLETIAGLFEQVQLDESYTCAHYIIKAIVCPLRLKKAHFLFYFSKKNIELRHIDISKIFA